MSTSRNDCLHHEQIARIGKAFSSSTRVEIIYVLEQAPRTVEALANAIGQSTANTSHHLQKLRKARLVETERQGVHITYRLADEAVGHTYRALRTLAEERLLEVREFLRDVADDDDALTAHDADELLTRARNQEVTVLDVRPAEEFEAGHLPEAISIPIEELEQRLADLPDDHKIVAYCRGPYCALSKEAVDTLRDEGFDAVRFTQGVPDWKERGLPVEHGPPRH